MTSLTTIKQPYEILNEFINDKILDIENILENENLFTIRLYYTLYNSAITAPIAKIIFNSQNFVYKLGALLKYETIDVRKLTKEEKQLLEIPFFITGGSTNIVGMFLKQIKGLIKMIPEEKRPIVVIAFIICFVFVVCFTEYMNHLDKQIDSKTIQMQNKIIDKAMDKLSENHKDIARIIEEYHKEILSSLETIDTNITYNGNEYTPQEIKDIKKMRFPKKVKLPIQVNTIKGQFRVTAINLEDKYIVIKKDNNEVETVYYADDLVSAIEDFKIRFKEAIDNEGQFFYIEASCIVKNGNKQALMLNIMKTIDK